MLTYYNFHRQNTDSDDQHMGEGEYRDSLNLIYTKSGRSREPKKQNVRGTEETVFTLPSGTNRCIGTYEDKRNFRLFFFNHNSNGDHGIYAYDLLTDSVTAVIVDSVLDFSTDRDNLISHVGVADQFLAWADGGRNEARKIHVQRAINTTNALGGDQYPQPWADEYITLIKQPPSEPLLATLPSTTAERTELTDKVYQFAYRYVYFDGEVSAFSPSTTSFPGSVWTQQNKVHYPSLTFEPKGTIPPDVKSVEFVARELPNGRFYSIGIRDSASASVVFDGTNAGEAIPDSDLFRQSDSIPQKPYSLAIAENRIFLANYISDYPLPSGISLSLSFESRGVPTFDLAGNLIGTDATVSVEVFLSNAADPMNNLYGGQFYHATIGGREYRLIPKGPDYEVVGHLYNPPSGSASQGVQTVYYYNPTTKNWRSRSRYRVGLLFRDKYGRPYPLVIDDSYVVDTGVFEEAGPRKVIRWDLSATPSSAIPEDAYTYQLVVTKNRSFQTIVNYVAAFFYYAKRNSGTGVVEASNPQDYKANDDYLVVDIGNLVEAGMGYSYQEGDRIRVGPWDGQYFDLAIQGLEGNQLLVENYEVPLIGGNTFTQLAMNNLIAYEIYRPFDTNSEQDVYYEVEQAYPIDNPGDPSRSFSLTDFEIDGDIWLSGADRFRSESTIDTGANTVTLVDGYFDLQTLLTGVEYFVWFPTYNPYPTGLDQYTPPSGAGFVESKNINTDRLGSNVRFSEPYIQGSFNGLSTFYAQNEEILDVEDTPIRKLQKTRSNASVIIALHERSCTSLYISKGFLRTGDGEELLSQTEKVIADKRPLKYGFGTIHPASVVEWDGSVYFFDAYRGEVVRYSNNGLTPISTDYRTKNEFLKYLEEDNQGQFVFGGFDQNKAMYFISFLDSGMNPVNTYGFDDYGQVNNWLGRYSFIPEYYGRVGDSMIMFKDGRLWKHESSSVYNNFFGVQYESELTFVGYAGPVESCWRHIYISSDARWSIEVTNDLGQSTSIWASELDLKDAYQYYAEILRDENTPASALEAGQIALRHGYMMESISCNVKLVNDSSNKVEIWMVALSTVEKRGHAIDR